MISRFEEKVGNPDWVTSGDIGPISKCARDLPPAIDLGSKSRARRILQALFDMGLPRYIARLVMESVKKPGSQYVKAAKVPELRQLGNENAKLKHLVKITPGQGDAQGHCVKIHG